MMYFKSRSRIALDFPPRYRKYFEAYCIKNCYCSVLQYYETAHPILYLNAVMNTKLQSDEHKNASFVPDLQPLLHSLEFKTKRIVLPAGEDITTELAVLLKEGIPCIVDVDGYFLPYHPCYHKQHENHTAVLFGYDALKKTVLLSDYMPPYFFHGALESCVLRDAETGSGAYLEHTGWPRNPDQLLLETLESTVHSFCVSNHPMYGGTALERYLEWMIHQNHSQRYYQEVHEQLGVYDHSVRLLLDYLEHAPNGKELELLVLFLEQWQHQWSRLKISLLKNIYSPKQTEDFLSLTRAVQRGIGTLQQRLVQANREVKARIGR